MDVYSDWIDACDAVAKDAANSNEVDDGLNAYEDLAADNGTEIPGDRNINPGVGSGGYAQGVVDDD